MPKCYEVHPDDVNGIACPTWAKWLDDRHVAVECLACQCCYTRRTWFPEFNAVKFPEGGKWSGGVPATCSVCAERVKEAKRLALPINPVLVASVKAHALANYEKGWDTLVEAYTDAEIWELIAGARTEAVAIKRAQSAADLHTERRQESRSW